MSREDTAHAVLRSVVRKTNANSHMVWQIIDPVTGSAFAGPPTVYPGTPGVDRFAGQRIGGNMGWKTKREADASHSVLVSKAREILGVEMDAATVNRKVDAMLKRNPRKKPTLDAFGGVVGKSFPFGKLADYPALKTQKARLLKGFQEIGFSKTIAASIVDAAQIRQSQRNRDGRAMFLQGADLLQAAKSHGYFADDPAPNPARKSPTKRVTLLAGNPVEFGKMGSASSVPYAVEVNQTGSWQGIAWFRDKARAVEYANAFFDRYEKVPVRVMHSARKKAKK